MRKLLKRGFLILFLTIVCAAGAEKHMQRMGEEEEVRAVVRFVIPEETEQEIRLIAIDRTKEEIELPGYFDYRKEGRASQVRDQAEFETCWAFASLTALETALLPEEALDFSRDHLSFHNSFRMEPEEGGSYIMSVAYLTAWQGPVLEAEDPYGDQVSPEGLKAAKHVQEVRMPSDKDYQAVKQTIYLYGGVESSLYVDFSDPREKSEYFNRENYSYCYEGEELPNHDVVIIGWDDEYPAENFNVAAPGNGAFICQNSWGTAFGEGGIFYVSYYDTNIGKYNAAFTKVEDSDNYDALYQSDLCGWCGQVGYNSDKASFANVYESVGNQQIQALGFYATGDDTEYRLAVKTDFMDKEELSEAEYVQSGYLQYPGFYTIELENPIFVEEGERFAAVVEIMTPDAACPIAVEYASEELGKAVDLSDGEGYISADNRHWERVEEEQSSNLCLKVYAAEAP